MKLEQLKEKYATGEYVCYIKSFDSEVINLKVRHPNFKEIASDYKLIHKKHSEIADAIIENPDIEVESRLGTWKFKKDTDDFFRTYFKDRDYRIKPIQDTGEEQCVYGDP